jgi:alkaline phosphatase
VRKILPAVLFFLLNFSCSLNRPHKSFLVDNALNKNIIIMIVDGMGFEHIKAARIYNAQKPLSFESYPCQARVTTCSYDGADITGTCLSDSTEVTDSAAAATAMATGGKVINGAISQEAKHGQAKLKTILEQAKSHGQSTGVVATKLFTDATPAAFISHVDTRKEYQEILTDIFNQTKPTLILGADNEIHRSFAVKSKAYRMVKNKTELKNLVAEITKNSCTNFCPAIYGGFGEHFMPGINKKVGLPLEILSEEFSKHDIPHLSEMVDAALKILSKNPKGFFLMVESSLPDMISHFNTQLDSNNSPPAILALVQELMEVEKATKIIEEFVKRTNTLLILTADHETGGLLVEADKVSCLGQKNCVPKVKWTSEKYEPMPESPSRHTKADVPLYAIGAGAQNFCLEKLNNISIPNLAMAK